MADGPETAGADRDVSDGATCARKSLSTRRLERLVGRARAGPCGGSGPGPSLWLPLAIVLVFLTVSWLGLWLDAPPLMRALGLGLFAAALPVSLWPLVRLRLPGRPHALDRLDRDAGLRHGPARALDDTLALGQRDPARARFGNCTAGAPRRPSTGCGSPPPRPGMPRRDRYALRAAGAPGRRGGAPSWPARRSGLALAAAFDWRQRRGRRRRPSASTAGSIRRSIPASPPLMIDLAGGEQRLRAPVKSTVVIRVAGKGDVDDRAGPGLTALPAPREPAQGPARGALHARRQRRALASGPGFASGVTLQGRGDPGPAAGDRLQRPAGGQCPRHLRPRLHGQGRLRHRVRRGARREGRGCDGPAQPGAGATDRLAPSRRTARTTPRRAPRSTSRNHPWAGARVKLTPRGQGRGRRRRAAASTIDFTLPQRPFTKPLAKALVEQRRKLVLDPDDRKRVQVALDALLIEPDRFTPQWGVFMGLRLGAERLRRAQDRPGPRSRWPTGSGRWRCRSRTATCPTPSASCAPPRSACARRWSAAPPTRRSSA